MPEDKAKDFLEDVFPAEIEQISDRRNVSLPGDTASLGAAVQAFRAARDLKAAIDSARGQRGILLRLATTFLSPVEELSRRIPFPKLQYKFESVTRSHKIDAEIEGYERALEQIKRNFRLTETTKPSTQLDLVGLAFSGGGIRSATFNLGVLQSLADLGILKFFDYLSTVSGGGYIGSWLTSWIWRERPHGGIATVGEKLKMAHQAQQANVAIPDEPRPIHHLRQYSNYLTPQLGLFSKDTWSAIATYVRNLLLNQLILIPAVAVILLLPRLVGKGIKIDLPPGDTWVWIALSAILVSFGVAMSSMASCLSRLRRGHGKQFQMGDLQLRICVPMLVAALGLSWIVQSQQSLIRKHEAFNWFSQLLNILNIEVKEIWLNWIIVFGIVNLALHLPEFFSFRDVKHARRYLISTLLSGGVAGILLYLLVHFGLWNWNDEPWHAVSWGPPLAILVFLAAVTIHVGVMGIYEPDEWREWRSSMAAWLLIYSLAWSGIFAISFYGPLGWRLLADWTATKATLILGWVGSTIAAILAGKSSQTDGSGGSSWIRWVTKLCPAAAVIGLLIAIALLTHAIVNQWSSSEETPVSQRSNQGEVIGTAKFSRPLEFEMSLKLVDLSDTSKTVIASYWSEVGRADLKILWALFLSCLLIAAGLARTVDVNEFSLHAFYRNRLVRSYLGASRKRRKSENGGDKAFLSTSDGDVRNPDPITDFDPNDDLKLAELSQSLNYDGPYPIVNTALNLAAGSELAWQQRKASSFILAPRFCGSQETGYRETQQFADGIKLGTSFAISGAAASPNMGYHTSTPMAFLLTLFNVRLGWWVGNPREKAWKYRGPRWSLFYLLTELFGQTDEKSWYVYLSDGGHFENLGIYELVRRRCKYIVACDAGADANMGFEDLGNAIRKIRIDFGVDVEIDLDMVRPLAGQRFSRWHHAIGVIRYDQADRNESVGMLVYIKASLTGDESGDVLEYAGHNPSFPHQSTADQFFDESQFESYRKLGEHIAWEILRFAPSINGRDDFFNALRRHWVTVPPGIQESFLGQKEALVKLEAKLRDDPQLARYDAEIYPELESFLGANPTGWPAPDPRAALHFCTTQLHLIENVFIALEFQRYYSYALNRGWMNLFRRWAVAPTFQKLWPGLRGSYSRRFVEFVEEQLIPCAPFRIVAGIQSGLMTRLVDEFRRDQLSAEISPQFPDALANPLPLPTGVRATWFAVPATDSPGKDLWAVDEAWAAAVVTKGPLDYDYQLYVWVRGAYRNLGIGGKLLDKMLKDLKEGPKGKILVDLGDEKPGIASYQQRKAAWLRFYCQRGFIREAVPTRQARPGQHPRLRLKLDFA